MAIYHLTAKIVSREKGRSAVAAAAYRAADCLYDERLGQTWNYTRKQGVSHTEILAPEGVPAWIYNRERLWNVVEASEKRKDSQLAREIEIALPCELDAETQIALLRDFVQREFVSKGMVADFSLHRDNLENPHAHILLTLRRVGNNGFGLKERSWNSRSNLSMWRIGWEEVANEHLARAGLAIRIDHRTLKAQQIDLIPGRKIGVSLDRQQDPTLPRRIAERVEEQRRIASLNGENILAEPSIALRALTHQQATFTKHDIARFLNTRTDGAEQFQAALLKVTTSPDLVALGQDDRGQQRYTSREMLELEEGMLHRAELMTLRRGHGVGPDLGRASFASGDLSAEQAAAFEYLVGEGDLKVLVKNGSLGTVEALGGGVLQVRLDRTGASVFVDTRVCRDLDHGYAATVYKAEGVTVDRSYVLATPHFDWYATYVALSRHSEAVTLFYAAEDFAGKFGWKKVVAHDELHDEVVRALSRARPKDLAHDHLEPFTDADLTVVKRPSERLTPDVRSDKVSMDLIDAQQQAAAERWREKQRAQELGLSAPEHERSADLNEHLDSPEDDPLAQNNRHDLSRGGLEDDLEL